MASNAITEEDLPKKLIYWKNQSLPNSGELFTDPLFPPNINSLLGLDSKGKPIDPKAYNDLSNEIDTNEITFARASEIFKNQKYELFSNIIEINDVIQGQISDCYFLSSIANLCKFPELILNLFKTKTINEEGYYEIIFYIDGIKQIVIIDDYLPVFRQTNRPCFAQPHDNKIWVMLLEKAWAKINGGYTNIIKGLPQEAFEFLTGMGSLSYDTKNKDQDDINEYKIEIIKAVQIADKNKCFISCSTNSDENIKNVGLVKDHAYTLVDFNEIKTKEGQNVYLFRLRNPWSKGEWCGDWSDKSDLWTEEIKNQVKYNNKEDGFFFMSDNDFFKYFSHVEICNILYDAKSITYTIEGEENLKNGIVFNIITKSEGILCVSVLRKNWRANRELRYQILPTHISVVKYDPDQKNKLKIFSDYNGTCESFRTCAMNMPVTKGNYLIYVYRDLDNADFTPDAKLKINIICSAEFTHAQMDYDERKKGFPLLQNIILQAEFAENNYDPDKGEDFNVISNQIRGNGIGHVIFYISNPGYFLEYHGSLTNVKNFIMLTPYITKKQNTFCRIVSSGKYLVLLGLMNGRYGTYNFNCYNKAFMTNKKLKENYESNDIDLSLYTDIKNDIRNSKLKESIKQTIVKTKTEFYSDASDGIVIYQSLSEIESKYGDYIGLLDGINYVKDDVNLKWCVIKGEYATYIGQINEEGKKQGKGLLINPKNIFVGEFYNNKQHGRGYIYNANKLKLYCYNYINGRRVGKPISPEEEQKMREIELEKEKERLEEEEKKRNEELKKLEEEQKKEEEKMKEELDKISQEEKEKLENAQNTAQENEIEQIIKLIKDEIRKKIEKLKEKESSYKTLRRKSTKKADSSSLQATSSL